MPVTQVLNSKANVKKNTNSDLPFSPQQPVMNSFVAVATAGQTVVNLTFSVDQALTDQLWLFVDGKKMRFGAGNDYIFTNVVGGLSSQITMLQPLQANWNVQVYNLGLKAESAFGVSNSFTALYPVLGQTAQPFVDQTSFITTATTATGSPAAGLFYSTIVGRAPMADLSQNLKAYMGIERIPAQQMILLQNEFGPNNEPVYGILNDTLNQIRLIGPSWANQIDTYGARLSPSTNFTESIEVTFYGTGLNALMQLAFSGNAYTIQVDGVTTQTGILNASYASISQARNYAFNTCVNLVSGLTLGIHTVTIKNTASGGAFHGFEILNESSSVKTAPGVSYVSGQKLISSAFNSTLYSAPVTGTRGGRVLVYQKSDGTIGQSFQAVDAAQANYTSTNHTNEEVVRTYRFREFGAARGDDFSLPINTGSFSYAFTLDDGTSSLVANAVDINGELIRLANNTGFVRFEFTGCGIDYIIPNISGTVADAITVLIDGTTVATITGSSRAGQRRQIASGLPYGTHTISILQSSASPTNTEHVHSFIVYQPKKPALPSGAIELADYNVLANFTANSTANVNNISTGVLRKASSRELTYVGTGWSTTMGIFPTHATGNRAITSTSGDYTEYTFFGTGFDFRTTTGGSDSATVTVSLQKLTTGGSLQTLNSTNFPGLTTWNYGNVTFTYASGNLNCSGTATAGNGAGVSGLTLGLYKVRFTNGAAAAFQISCLDIITPIHSTKSNLYADLQNTLPVGSNAISDNRQITPVKGILPVTKAWVQALGINSSATNSTATLVPIPDMSCTIKTTGGPILIMWNGSFYSANQNTQVQTQIYVDGVPIFSTSKHSNIAAAANNNMMISDSVIVPVIAGTHSIQVFWANGGSGTVTVGGSERQLLVQEK